MQSTAFLWQQAGLQMFQVNGKQGVIAVPETTAVQRYDKQAGPKQALQQRLAVFIGHQPCGQGRIKAFQNAGAHQKIPLTLIHALGQHFVKIFKDVLIAGFQLSDQFIELGACR